jgi:hypothetical protein
MLNLAIAAKHLLETFSKEYTQETAQRLLERLQIALNDFNKSIDSSSDECIMVVSELQTTEGKIK